MLTEQRYQVILQTLSQQKISKLNELVRLTQASESTVRRDLDTLAKQGLLERIHGGARLRVHLASDKAQTEREQQNRTEKNKIATYVAKHYLQDQQYLFLDAGTTVQEIIPFLAEHSQLTVVTNSITAALRLSELNIHVFLPSGQVKPQTKALVGPQTLTSLDPYRFDLALIGTNAIASNGDFMTPDINEASVKKTVCQHANEVVVMTDASKFAKVAFATFSDINHVNAVITTNLPPKLRSQFPQKNIKVIRS